jgi:hypothetical protein
MSETTKTPEEETKEPEAQEHAEHAEHPGHAEHPHKKHDEFHPHRHGHVAISPSESGEVTHVDPGVVTFH